MRDRLQPFQTNRAGSQLTEDLQEPDSSPDSGWWYVILYLSFDRCCFLARCGDQAKATQVARDVARRLRNDHQQDRVVFAEFISERKAIAHEVEEKIRVNQERGVRGDPELCALAARLALQSMIAPILEPIGEAHPGEFWPASAFPKGMAARLRMAARKNRKTKRVASRVVDGVVCYSVEDARRWWPKEMSQAGGGV